MRPGWHDILVLTLEFHRTCASVAALTGSGVHPPLAVNLPDSSSNRFLLSAKVRRYGPFTSRVQLFHVMLIEYAAIQQFIVRVKYDSERLVTAVFRPGPETRVRF